MRVIACLAAGLGSRGTARGCASAPHPVLQWLGEAAEPRQALSAYFLRAWPSNQVQLDARSAVRSAVREGEGSAAEAIESLSRSPHWGWTALDPQSTLRLSVQVGARTVAMAQAMVHQLAPLVAPGVCRSFCAMDTRIAQFIPVCSKAKSEMTSTHAS